MSNLGYETTNDATVWGRSFATRWLKGCDGPRNAVRKFSGFEFAGTELELTSY